MLPLVGFDQFLARTEQPALFRVPDHRGADPAFDGIGGIASLDLAEHGGRRAVDHAVQPHQRRMPDRSRIVFVPVWHRRSPDLDQARFSGRQKIRARTSILSRGAASGALRRILEGGMRGEARAAVLFRVVALEQDHLVLFQPREIEPSMVRVVEEAIGLADLVAIDEIRGHEVFGFDRSRVAQSQRRRFHRSPDRTPYVDLGEVMLQPRFRLGGRQMVTHAAWSRFRGVVVVDRLAVLARIFFAALRQYKIANLMVEDDDLFRSGHSLQHLLDLRVIDPLHFILIVKIVDRGLLMRQLETLLVERQLAHDLARVANRHGMRDELPRYSRRSRRRLVRVVNRLLAGLGDIV